MPSREPILIQEPPPVISRRRAASIIACITYITSIGNLLVGLLTVCVPVIAKELNIGLALQLWPVSIFALTCGCTLLPCGAAVLLVLFSVLLTALSQEPPIAYADIHLSRNITTDQALDWVKLLAEDSLAWGYSGWGGHVGGTFVAHFNPLPALTNDNGTSARAAFQRATDFALALGGTSHVAVEESFSTIFNRGMVPKDTKMGGNFHFTTTRLMPTSMFGSAEGIESLTQYMREAIEMGFDPRSFYTPVTTPFVYKANETRNAEPKDYGTSMTQAWHKALWHVESSKVIPVDSTYQERLTALTNLTTLTVKLEKIMGADGGSYMNVADPYTPDWKESFYGLDNYEKLLKIKNKYDPQRLLKCWKCVGFDEEKESDLERFTCNKKIQADIIKGLKA
ncbi:unnamed protein product [Clonostachys chloroleuca]|uniref:Berberine/berberine-like domain-containing protein n=1 Tax=Clonostachys chloroleuca TaxID=1926264 RepID=A0AA35QDC0_9HYPO|nr:unnamed protein product [Clonostachys chloroleuca]